MTDTIEPLKTTRVIGAVGTGKTQRLIEHITSLLALGTDPNSIMIVCATPQAVRAFAARLADASPNQASTVTIKTARDAALDILASEEAVRFTGREPRLLTSYEEMFLLEDLKVSGLRPRRLREMLKFFYRSWTELADDDPAWLLPGEEADVHALLKANLAFIRALVEPEVSNLAVRCLDELDSVRTTHRCDHVLVDDYQCLSRASQVLTGKLAKRSLTVAGDANACVEAYDSYPHAAGLAEFTETHPNVIDERLTVPLRAQAARRAASNLLADPCMDTLELTLSDSENVDEATVLTAASPAAEFERVAHAIAKAVQDGEQPSRIAVAVPNAAWAHNIAAALRHEGMRAQVLPDSQPVRGDIRDSRKCVPARVLTALRLVADPTDATAWRSWCGFGDYLVNSAAIANLRTFADKQGMGLVETLEAVSRTADTPDTVVGARRVEEAYRAGCALINQVQELTGQALLNELARLVTEGAESEAPTVVADLCLSHDADNSATAMAQRATRRLLAPVLTDEEAVAVIPYDSMVGLSPNMLVISGFVNGFIPCRDYFDAAVTPLDKQERMHARDTRRVYALVGKAGRTLALSYFTAVDLESAGKLKLKINRIRMEHGKRICSIAPSEFLARITAE